MSKREHTPKRELERHGASPPWFHLEEIPAPGTGVELDPGEASHASRARRLRAGAHVVVFDGFGVTADAELFEANGRTLAARIVDRREHPRERPAIHLASALPKRDRQSHLIGMGTQVGMTSFTPLSFRRSVVKPHAGHDERWSRLLREACKQSRRPHLPELRPPSEATTHARSLADDGPVFVLAENGESALALLGSSELAEADAIHLIVGPEGGIDEDETRALAGFGARSVSLGRGILRIETAAVAALAVFGTLRGAR